MLAAAAAGCGALATSAIARWAPPIEVATPMSTEVLGPQVASSATGAAAVSFNDVDVDAQANASAFLALAAPHGAFRAAQPVPGVQEILATAYSGSTLELLSASGPPGQPCCSTVQVMRRAARSTFGRGQTIVTGVGGGATGRLVPLGGGRMLAVIAGPQRLWVSEARGSGRFATPHGLTQSGSAPAALAVTATPGGGSIVVWTQGSGQSVIGASAGPGASPSRPRTLLTVPPGHAIDGLQIVARPVGTTMAWTESWNDVAGAYHARAMAADLRGPTKPVRPRQLSAAADVASALALTTDAHGNEVAAWNACSPSTQACTLQSRILRARWFDATSRLGQIDPGQSPQLTTGPNGTSLLGWISAGHVLIASLRPGAAHFGAGRPMSGSLADNLALAFGPTSQAVASWTQGTFTPGVFASVWR